jgi:hypothetical protein
MVLIHTGAPKGADLIASKWASNRQVNQIAFKPDWAKHGTKRAGFARNDAMLAALPIGVIVFPGTGIQAQLAREARRLGIPLWNYGDQRATAPITSGS